MVSVIRVLISCIDGREELAYPALSRFITLSRYLLLGATVQVSASLAVVEPERGQESLPYRQLLSSDLASCSELLQQHHPTEADSQFSTAIL